MGWFEGHEMLSDLHWSGRLAAMAFASAVGAYAAWNWLSPALIGVAALTLLAIAGFAAFGIAVGLVLGAVAVAAGYVGSTSRP